MKFVIVSAISLVMVLSVTVLLIHNMHYRFREPGDKPDFMAKINPKAVYLQIVTGVHPKRLRRRKRRRSL